MSVQNPVAAISIMTLNSARALKRFVRHYRNSRLSASEVFASIYANNTWGGQKGVFYSGSGTHDSEVSVNYVQGIRDWLQSLSYDDRDVVDLGCGDFHIGNQFSDLCRSYVGVDIVPELIEHNKAYFSDERVSFIKLDITTDDLPAGNICILREVLQHLSNSQIEAVLPRLKRYKKIIVTDRQPSPGRLKRPNMDKIQGPDLRLFWGSAIYLNEPPFSLPPSEISTLFEFPGPSHGIGMDNGVLRTFLYEPRADEPAGMKHRP